MAHLPPHPDTTAPALVVLRRGDRVLIAMNEDPGHDDLVDWLQGLTDSFPGVQFVVLGGVAGMAVQPGDSVPKEE